LEIVGWTAGEMLRQHGEAVKPAHCGDGARDGPRRQPFAHQTIDEMFEIAAIETFHGLLAARSERSKALEIAAVAFEGVIGEPPLDAEVRHIRVDEIVAG
jgi:hypothetical protein